MSEQVSTIAREAKGIQQSLKEALKSRDPWDREVDFQRKNLRRHYLRLLLVYPYAKESKDAETHLWMQTSYTFISSYKQRLAALDNALHAPSRNQQKQPRQGGHGPVEYRKLLQRFRQFLAEEEKFWSQLVVRFRRSFDLTEAHSTLVALNILPAVNQTEGNDANQNATDDPNASGVNGRNHFQFPTNDSGVSLAPRTHAERESRLAIVSKALVCLGDIARYRELYHEGGGRPKAGHEESMPPKRNNRTKRNGAEVIPRARNYEKAQQCYEQARLLVPYEGNPSHQLAILSSYKKDAFGSLVHYYRALCVRQPYDTAAENLGTVLTKTLDQWSARQKREEGSKDAGSVPLTPKLRVDAFKEKIVVLHALWRLGVEKMDSISPRHAQDVRDDFLSLVSERGLPPDIISRAVILSHGALWKHRMICESGSHQEDGHAAIESEMLTHVLALHDALLQVGIAQLAEAPPEENELAQRITAIFRRTLPALRIASKWLKANYQYVSQAYDAETVRANKMSVGSSTRKRPDSHTTELATAISLCWRKYSQFSADLRSMFPPDRLPRLNATLEEDVDTKGFLPLTKATVEDNVAGRRMDRVIDGTGDTNNANSTAEGQMHPNEEQLMRIADLLDDAQTLMEITELENLSIVFGQNQFMMERSNAVSSSVVDEDQITRLHETLTTKDERFEVFEWRESDDDDQTESTSRTEDDPVGDAFRQVLAAELEDDDDDDDEIVWNPRPTFSPVSPPIPLVMPASPPHATVMTPTKPVFSPIGTAPRSPIHQSPFASPVALHSPTTAEDLLNNVMGVSRTSGGSDIYRSQHQSESSAPQPQLLFGSGPPNHLSHSIWSRSLDDQSLEFAGTTHSYNSQQQLVPPSLPQDFSQSKWYPNSAQSHLSGAFPSSSFAPPSRGIRGSHHYSASSSSISVAQLLASQQQSSQTPFRYPAMSQPQVVHSHQFQPLSSHADAAINPNHGVRMHYGHGAIHNYHGNYLDQNHPPAAVGQALASPWGGNTG